MEDKSLHHSPPRSTQLLINSFIKKLTFWCKQIHYSRCCTKDSTNIYFYLCFVKPSFNFGSIYKEQSYLISQFQQPTLGLVLHRFTPFDYILKPTNSSQFVSHDGSVTQQWHSAIASFLFRNYRITIQLSRQLRCPPRWTSNSKEAQFDSYVA